MAQDIKKQPTVVEKKNPAIIEDASFYQDRTYQALKIKIDNASRNGKSFICIDAEMGKSMIKYLENKGFTIRCSTISYSTYTYIYW